MKLAVYTTVYPGVEPYMKYWYRSLREQTDQDFELWIGLDAVGPDAVRSVVGENLEANWVQASAGATPAQVREQSLARIIEACSAVVLVDSDDVLHSSRVEAARTQLSTCELGGCGLRLVDQRGNHLGQNFELPPELKPEEVFPRTNIFGFSNSVFRSDLLRKCLPIPAPATLVDWFLATRAWLYGAKLSFDSTPRMDYRQHSANTARVRFPVTAQQVASDTALVMRHYRLLLAQPPPGYLPERADALAMAAANTERFHSQIVGDSKRFSEYVEALNALRPPAIWWNCVAHPSLSGMWSAQDHKNENP
jgi:hypothetical protein